MRRVQLSVLSRTSLVVKLFAMQYKVIITFTLSVRTLCTTFRTKVCLIIFSFGLANFFLSGLDSDFAGNKGESKRLSIKNENHWEKPSCRFPILYTLAPLISPSAVDQIWNVLLCGTIWFLKCEYAIVHSCKCFSIRLWLSVADTQS